MSFARRIESRLERLIEGASAGLFGGKTGPLDIENKLLRTADLATFNDLAGPAIPNVYALYLHPENLTTPANSSLATDLARSLTALAMAEGWRLDGPVAITITSDPELSKRKIRCESRIVVGENDPWGSLIGANADRAYPIKHIRSLIGRGTDCDIQILDADISRNHCVIFARGQENWIVDLASSNGTRVNDVEVTSSPVIIRPNDYISLGTHRFTLKRI